MKTLSFYVGPTAAKLIDALAGRAARMAEEFGFEYDRVSAMMDLRACHANGCPLDLAKLTAADDVTFAHDVFGIRRHMNRKTGRLMDCFVPRCAAREEART